MVEFSAKIYFPLVFTLFGLFFSRSVLISNFWNFSRAGLIQLASCGNRFQQKLNNHQAIYFHDKWPIPSALEIFSAQNESAMVLACLNIICWRMREKSDVQFTSLHPFWLIQPIPFLYSPPSAREKFVAPDGLRKSANRVCSSGSSSIQNQHEVNFFDTKSFSLKLVTQFAHMSILFEIPQILGTEVLSQWCEVVDLMKLDSACCNHVARDQLLSVLLLQKGFILAESIDYSVVTYCQLRKLTVLKLRIKTVFNNSKKLKLTQSLHCFTNLHQLTLSLTIGDGLVGNQFVVYQNCINKCQHLTCLKCIDLGYIQGFLVGIQPRVLNRLRTLQLEKFSLGFIAPDAWLHLSVNCKNVRNLQIAGNNQTQVIVTSVLKLFSHDNIKLLLLSNSSFVEYFGRD